MHSVRGGKNADSVVKTLSGLWFLLNKVNFSKIKSHSNVAEIGYFSEIINKAGLMFSLV